MNLKVMITAVALTLMPLASACNARAAEQAPAEASDRTVTIPVEGMTCASCSLAVRTAVRRIDGVKSVNVSREQKQAVIVYDSTKASPEQFVDAINKLGYRAGAPLKR